MFIFSQFYCNLFLLYSYSVLFPFSFNINRVDLGFHTNLYSCLLLWYLLVWQRTNQRDFFVESPIILLAAIIWFLKIYEKGKYCTFPHAIKFLSLSYAQIFPIVTSYDELANFLFPFMDAWEGRAQDQLYGQIASAKIPLSHMISPALYYLMVGDDFSLDIQ